MSTDKDRFDRRMVIYMIEDIQKDLQYYIAKLDLYKQRISKEVNI